uniref:Uncharacterized protein n=1 Tax=mine drainage metagenome TaxID=410659 RepID=E6QDW9_9ZZZZ
MFDHRFFGGCPRSKIAITLVGSSGSKIIKSRVFDKPLGVLTKALGHNFDGTDTTSWAVLGILVPVDNMGLICDWEWSPACLAWNIKRMVVLRK